MTTRADLEASIVRRLRGKMALAGLSTATDGENSDLDDALAQAMRRMGLDHSSPVADGDVAGLTPAQLDELLDRAELRTLETIAGNLDTVDITVGPRSERLGQLLTQVEQQIGRLAASIEREFGAGSLTPGTLDLNFQAQESED